MPLEVKNSKGSSTIKVNNGLLSTRDGRYDNCCLYLPGGDPGTSPCRRVS